VHRHGAVTDSSAEEVAQIRAVTEMIIARREAPAHKQIELDKGGDDAKGENQAAPAL